MSRLSQRLLGGLDPLTYLNKVKSSFRNADLTTYHSFLSEVDAWIRDQSSDLDFARLGRIATLLQFKPHLLRGFNTLLRPNHRLECSTNVKEVRYFVIVTPKGAKILSPKRAVPFPASDLELRSLVLLKMWRNLLGGPDEEDWLICIAVLLQVILDDPTTDVVCYGKAYNCLRELAKDSILAPSVLVNNLKLVPGLPIRNEAIADIYKSSVAGTSIRLSVLHIFEKRDQKLYKDICSEVIAWGQLKHPNILPFIGVNTKLFSSRFCFISLWASNGDLMTYLKQHPEHDRFNSIHEIVDGINYLHSLNPPIAHGDIKGANVHVTDRLVCCLADFGLSSIAALQRFQGSISWTAPEVMDPTRSHEQDPQAGDIYSLGCTIYEIYTGLPPLFSTHEDSASILLAVLSGERPDLPPPGTWSVDEEDVWWLVGHCWADKPEDRPNINLMKQALRDIRTQKLATTDLLDASTDDTEDFATDIDIVKTWVADEAVSFGKMLSSCLRNFSSIKLDGGARLSNIGKVLFSRRRQTITYQKFLAKTEASHQTAETPPLSNSTTSSRPDSPPLHTPPSTLTTDSLPTPPTSPVLNPKTHVKSPSSLRADAPPFDVSAHHFQYKNSQFQRKNNPKTLLINNPSDTGALRQFLVHKLALQSQVRLGSL